MSVETQLLGQIPLFEALEPDDVTTLARCLERHQLTAGETLFHAGDPGDSLFIVCKGNLELSIRDTAGQKIVLKTCEPGELFGELALLDEGPRTATAVAASDTELVSLDRDALLLLVKKKPETALHLLAGMGAMTRRADELLRTRVVRNANDAVDGKATLIERSADWISWFSGSMYFLILNAAFFAVWVVWNTLPLATPAFDPFPFGFLTMAVSLEAIFLSIFVLISQNRQAAKDRVRSDVEYEINVKAELEVAHLHDKVDRMHQEVLGRMTRYERQLGVGRRDGDSLEERRSNLGRHARRAR
jgi:CRP/FNR family transcriptional regulator, cyclic AMP receptor protein